MLHSMLREDVGVLTAILVSLSPLEPLSRPPPLWVPPDQSTEVRDHMATIDVGVILSEMSRKSGGLVKCVQGHRKS
jgi:hypothetical protein